MRLHFCKWQGDEGQGEDDGEFHLRIPKCSAGAQRVDPSTPPTDRGVRRGAEPDQRVEGSHHFHRPAVSYQAFLMTIAFHDLFCKNVFVVKIFFTFLSQKIINF